MSSCVNCNHFGLSIVYFRDVDDDVSDHDEQEEENESSESVSDSESSGLIKYYQWKSSEYGYLTKKE